MIACGHPPAIVWDYTPAQAYAFAELAAARARRDRSEMLSLTAMAVRGEAKELKKLIKELSSE